MNYKSVFLTVVTPYLLFNKTCSVRPKSYSLIMWGVHLKFLEFSSKYKLFGDDTWPLLSSVSSVRVEYPVEELEVGVEDPTHNYKV